MDTTKNFFENPNAGNGSGWGAGVGGLIGAALGSNGGLGLGGNSRDTVSPDQLDARFNSLQGQMAAAGIREEIGDVALGLGAGIAGVKDAVTHSSAHNQLALCGLGHTVQAGFASTNQTILMEGARTRELQLMDSLAQARAEVAAARNDAGHASTQVLINQVIAAGK